MNGVLARPARRGKECVQPIGIRPLVGIWDYLPTWRLLTFRGVHHSPVNLRGIKGHFQGRHYFFAPFFGDLKNSGCQRRRWRAGFGGTIFLCMTVWGAHKGSSLSYCHFFVQALAVHPTLGLDLQKPVLSCGNASEIFPHMLLSHIADGDLVPLAIHDGDAKQFLREENALRMMT